MKIICGNWKMTNISARRLLLAIISLQDLTKESITDKLFKVRDERAF